MSDINASQRTRNYMQILNSEQISQKQFSNKSESNCLELINDAQLLHDEFAKQLDNSVVACKESKDLKDDLELTDSMIYQYFKNSKKQNSFSE